MKIEGLWKILIKRQNLKSYTMISNKNNIPLDKKDKTMSKKIIAATIISVTMLSTTITGYAESTDNSKASADTMAKDAWLDAMAPMLPNMICKGFMGDAELKKRFTEINMSFDQCVGIIPEIEKKCREQIYKDIPATIDDQSASVWGKKLGECIGKDFAEKYLMPKS